MNFCTNCGNALADRNLQFCPQCGTKIQRALLENTDAPHAGFWIRFGAYVIDIIILCVPAFFISLFLAFVLIGLSYGSSQSLSTGRMVLNILIYLALIPVILLYFALQESSAKQATFGKRAVGLRVTGSDGNRIGPGKALIRTLVKFLPFIGPLGCLLIGFTSKKQGLHDMVASTSVRFRQ